MVRVRAAPARFALSDAPSHHRTFGRTIAPSHRSHHRTPRSGDASDDRLRQHRCMVTDFSNQLADAAATAARSVVQVQGRRAPASGVVYAPGVVVTTMRAIGREEG